MRYFQLINKFSFLFVRKKRSSCSVKCLEVNEKRNKWHDAEKVTRFGHSVIT